MMVRMVGKAVVLSSCPSPGNPRVPSNKPIKKGEQLIVLCDPPPKKPAETKAVKDNKCKEPTWFAAAKKADVKRKQ